MRRESCQHDASEIGRPYEVVGAGQFVAAIWKHQLGESEWSYEFSIANGSEQTMPRFGAEEITNLRKVLQVLAAVIADDGCTSHEVRVQLTEIAQRLDW